MNKENCSSFCWSAEISRRGWVPLDTGIDICQLQWWGAEKGERTDNTHLHPSMMYDLFDMVEKASSGEWTGPREWLAVLPSYIPQQTVTLYILRLDDRQFANLILLLMKSHKTPYEFSARYSIWREYVGVREYCSITPFRCLPDWHTVSSSRCLLTTSHMVSLEMSQWKIRK